MDYQWIIAAILIGGALFTGRHLVMGRLRKKRITDNFPLAHQKLIIAMASAANTDGDLDPAELDTIHEMMNRLSWRDYSREEVQDLILAIEPVETKNQFSKLGKGLLETQKLAILKAAHAVVGSEGNRNASENSYLSRLAAGLKLPTGDVQAVLSR